MTDLQKELFLLSDSSYRDFHARLMPTVSKEKIIGIRAPVLKKFAASFAKEERAKEFLSQLPHRYYEENNLHGLLIMKIHDFNICISETERFLPFIDNWATCDMLKPESFKAEPDALLKKIKKWRKSEPAYTVRYAVKCLMDFYLEDNFSEELLLVVSGDLHDDYYVKMGQAWFLQQHWQSNMTAR